MSLLFVSVLNADTVGQWLFDEGSGDVVHDSSGNGNDGTFVGEPEWVKDTPWGEGLSLEFDGAGAYSEYVEVEDAPSLNVTDEITVEAWIKPTDDAHGGIVCKGGEDLSKGAYLVAISSQYLFELNIHAGGEWHWAGNIANIPLTPDKWQHVAGVWDGKTLICYQDGEEISEMTVEGPADTTDDPLYIGCSGPDGGLVYTGLMDEVRISDRALSVNELGFNAPLKPSAVSSLDKLAVVWGAIKQR